jgi:thymidylate synthase
MFEVILACTETYGIGKNNKLPWVCRDELKLFREKTINSVILCGKNTYDFLPDLDKRIIYPVSRKTGTLEQHIDKAKSKHPDNIIFIAGGSQIYDYVFRKLIHRVSKLHISIMNKSYQCDTYISELNLRQWVIIEEYKYTDFNHYVLQYDPRESQYTDLITSIPSSFRTTRNGETASVFGKHISFDLSDGIFPLLTTKKMFFRGIVEELLFFIRGETNTKLLEEKGINIWKGNTNRDFLNSIGMENRNEGFMGPMYGYQWRFFNSPYDEQTGKNINDGVDQLQNVINLILKDPMSRRIILTSFNPAQSSEGVLYPCHSLIVQFYVTDNGSLNMFCFNRSQDLFLGTPFNIASSALLLILISKITNKTPGTLHMSLGDVHLYKNHYDLAIQQTYRIPYCFPKLKILKNIKSIKDIETMTFQDFSLENYKSHPIIKAEMVA